ncbi:hypothetical protein [Faecalicatena orotica]|uniref:hypothetical protein n=1 Tax=Faecalicatena orotica TaxID=1544 RepID=UPI0011B1D29E
MDIYRRIMRCYNIVNPKKGWFEGCRQYLNHAKRYEREEKKENMKTVVLRKRSVCQELETHKWVIFERSSGR